MKCIKTLCYTIIILLLNTMTVYATYLPPETIDGIESYNLYDVIDIKNGTQKTVSSLIYGKGKEFYINNCFIRTYENSIVYYLNDRYEPIQIQEFSSNGNTIKLPSPETIDIQENSFYLSRKQLQDFFEIDVESQGILYEKEETEIQPIGLDINFLEQNLTSLGYQYLGSGYCYEKNGTVNNYVFFNDDGSILIQWYYNTSEDTVDLLLQALFPNSYHLMKGNLFNINGEYDNRTINTNIMEDFIYITIKNINTEETETPVSEETNQESYITEEIYEEPIE